MATLDNVNYFNDPRVISRLAGSSIIISASRQAQEIKINPYRLGCEAIDYISVDDYYQISFKGDPDYYQAMFNELPSLIREAIEYRLTNGHSLKGGVPLPMPCVNALCTMCDGDGHVVNPSIDAGGLSDDDFYADPEFYDDYMGGRYDVTCPECNGQRVIGALDDNGRLSEDQREALEYIERVERERYEDARDRAHELAWGY